MKAYLLAVGVALFASATAIADSPRIEAQPDGAPGVFIAATLAADGSWEAKAAPSFTRLAITRRNAAIALRKGHITVDQALRIQAKADEARALLDKAVASCAQDNRTGKCTRNQVAADRLLEQATVKLLALR
jgi:hypothetical protein